MTRKFVGLLQDSVYQGMTIYFKGHLALDLMKTAPALTRCRRAGEDHASSKEPKYRKRTCIHSSVMSTREICSVKDPVGCSR
mmetsp:Transcript_23533/g.33820  ORF Transcript_23533/g.33820 Transcript_23533/m.33820 type:complete len:82 (+) Transcript_23533:643-888(+)